MNHQNFVNGRMANIFLYLIGMAATLLYGGITQKVALPVYITFSVLIVLVFLVLLVIKPGVMVSERTYAKILCVAMIILADVLCYTFGSIDVMLCVLMLQTIFVVMFLDRNIFLFHFILVLTDLVLWSLCGLFLFQIEKIQSYHVFVLSCLIAAQWLCSAIIRLFSVQREHMADQEQSLDDMLRLLTVKCREYQDTVKRRLDFLANMSHEMRTPINSVLGMNEMILRESRDKSVQEYADNIYKSGQFLLSVINDIHDFSKIEVGKMELTPVIYNMFSLLQDVVSLTHTRAEEKKLLLNLEIDEKIPAQLYGDDTRLRQVLINLLSNAVRYTNEGSITLKMSARNISEYKVALYCEVRDTGIGIKEEIIPCLFEAFRMDPEVKNQSILGTGLGLAITHEILQMMGTDLMVESEYGAGSKFYFEVVQDIVEDEPIGDIRGKFQRAVSEHQYNVGLFAPGAKILVVDDNEINRKVFCNLLKQTGTHISQADSGRKCLEMVKKEPFHMIFLDHMMPGMNGIDTLHEIRKTENFCKDVPIIVLTANVVSGAREDYLKEGFDDYLPKPILPERLEEIVRQYIPKGLISEPDGQGRPSVPPPSSHGVVPMQLPEIDGIFWGYAMSHFPNEEMLLSSVEDFYQLIPSMADKLEKMYHCIHEDGVLQNYQITVHGMKSSARLIGAMRLSGCAGTLEMAAARSLYQLIEVLTPIFLEDWRSYEEKLAVLAGEDESEGDRVKKEDDAAVLSLLEQISGATEVMDLDSMDDGIEQLDQYALPKDCQPLFKELQVAITNLDTDNINALTERMTYILTDQDGGKK